MTSQSPPPDYNARTTKQLRAKLKKRRISHKDLKLKAQLVSALQESDRLIREAEEERVRLEREALTATLQKRGLHVPGNTLEELRANVQQENERIREEKERTRKASIWPTLFQRKFKADPSQKSFMDFPAEVRVMVYRSLFDHPDVTDAVVIINYDPTLDRFKEQRSDLGHFNNIISTLNILGTLNRTIRKETRPIFWSLASFTLAPCIPSHYTGDVAFAPYYIAIFERFFRGLGDGGRSGIISLVVPDSIGCWCCSIQPLDLSEAGYLKFMSTCSMLSDCTSLTALRITVSEYYLFREDQMALEAFFLQGGALQSKSLVAFQKILQSLPNLRNVDLDIPAVHRSRVLQHGLAHFLQYAFTGGRRLKLWNAAASILGETKLQPTAGQVHVNRERIHRTPNSSTLTDYLKSGEE
jgi:hypothetical protein